MQRFIVFAIHLLILFNDTINLWWLEEFDR